MNMTRIMLGATVLGFVSLVGAVSGLKDVCQLGEMLCDALPWIAVTLNIAGTICSIRRSHVCWVLWGVSCVAWLAVVVPAVDVAQMANWGFYLVMNVVGFIAWRQ